MARIRSHSEHRFPVLSSKAGKDVVNFTGDQCLGFGIIIMCVCSSTSYCGSLLACIAELTSDDGHCPSDTDSPRPDQVRPTYNISLLSVCSAMLTFIEKRKQHRNDRLIHYRAMYVSGVKRGNTELSHSAET